MIEHQWEQHDLADGRDYKKLGSSWLSTVVAQAESKCSSGEMCMRIHETRWKRDADVTHI